MRREIQPEPERDPALAAALLDAYGDEPPSPERLEALRARIRQRAETEVRPVAGGVYLAHESGTPRRLRWSFSSTRRPIVWGPALLAAALAGVLLLRPDARQAVPPAPAIQAVGYATPEQALTARVSDAEFARTVTGEEDPAALLAIAVEAGTPPRP